MSQEVSTKDYILTFLPISIIALLFLISWTDRDYVLQDDWYAAVSILDSARTTEDQNLKKEYIERGGKWLLELKEKYPFHAKLRMFVGYYYIQSGEWDKAIDELHYAIEEGKGGIVNQIEYQARDFLTNAVMNKTQILMQQQKYDDVLATMRNSYPYAPEHISFLNHYANLFANMNRIDSALYYFERIVQIDPRNQKIREHVGNLYFNIANNLAKNGNFDAAYPNYMKAIQYIQNNPHYYNNLANVELSLNKFEDAVTHFNKAIELEPNNPTFKGNLKIAENRLNNQQ